MNVMQENCMDMGFEWWDAERCKAEVKDMPFEHSKGLIIELQLHSSKFVGGCYQRTAAKFYPAKVVHAIADKALSCGAASLHLNTQVLSLSTH